MNNLKHCRTERTLKSGLSNRTLDSLVSHKTVKSHKTQPRVQGYEPLRSPQGRIKNWCTIEHDIMQNIYLLKHKKPSRADTEYNTAVNSYDQILSVMTELESKIKDQRQIEATIRHRLNMALQDQQSRTIRNLDLISQKEELDQILEVYNKRFPEQGSVLFRLIEVQIQLRLQTNSLEGRRQQMQELSEQQMKGIRQQPRTNHLDRKIHNYRLQLMQIQQRINCLCEQYSEPLIREVLCSFYTKKCDQTQNQMGIELWIGKNGLTSELDKHVFSNFGYLKQQGFFQLYLEYLQVLTKIESNYVQIQRVTLQTEAEYEDSEGQQFQKAKEAYQQSEKVVQQLQEKVQKLQLQLSEWHSNQQLFKLQCEMSHLQPKRLVRDARIQQQNRVHNIRRVKQRVEELRSILTKQTHGLRLDLGELKDSLEVETQKLKGLTQQMLGHQSERVKKETLFGTVKLPSKMDKSSLELDFTIDALEKKLDKLQIKKQHILNSGIQETPKKEFREIQNIKQTLSSYQQTKKGNKPSSKSSSKIRPLPLHKTCNVAPYQPLDKAIDRLVTFKKSLAVDKAKLNKAVNMLMRNI